MVDNVKWPWRQLKIALYGVHGELLGNAKSLHRLAKVLSQQRCDRTWQSGPHAGSATGPTRAHIVGRFERVRRRRQ
ncbi:hypothetical protein LMG27174_06808 [Paraburkholderia rhynchosiae]|uniref:Uncharacterized protein n=1 Tax=Paraburkholderia rhynchosiae TaxID=487049 RepID=A0A6J5CQW5_9BURK|nr:hypothetical protein LMG27174_06808 [Paraburkholderia rhynchosiae]